MSKRPFMVMLAAGLVISMFAMPVTAQESRWDGADDLPVNPLACPVAEGEEAAEEEGEMMDAPEYNGGVAVNAPDRKSTRLNSSH